MRNEVTYEEILAKKFKIDDEVRPFDRPDNFDIENQPLLNADAAAEAIEDSADQITISDVVSHDTVDSQGQNTVVKVAREIATKGDIKKHIEKKKMLRNASPIQHFVPTEQNVVAKYGSGIIDKSNSVSEDLALLSQNTKGAVPPKSKIEELFSSDGQKTVNDMKQPGAFEASKEVPHELDEERGGRVETPPDFVASEINLNENELEMGKSIK